MPSRSARKWKALSARGTRGMPALLVTLAVLSPWGGLRADPPRGDETSCLQRPPRIDPREEAFLDLRSAEAGLFVASTKGLLRGTAEVPRVEPHIGPVLGIAVSADRRRVAAVGFGRLLRSADGGRTFTARDAPEDAPFHAAAFAGERLLVFSHLGNAWELSEAGESTPVPLPVRRTWWGAAFADAKRGFLVGTCETLLLTLDGGRSWELRRSPPGAQGVAVSGTAVFVTGQGGVFRSDDDGRSFERVAESKSCIRIDARDGAVVAACHSNAPDLDDGLLYSADGRQFAPARLPNLQWYMGAAIEPDGRIAAALVKGVLVAGRPDEMMIVYESPASQEFRARAARSKAASSRGEAAGSAPAQERRPRPRLPPPMTLEEQERFLATRLPPGTALLTGTFRLVSSAQSSVGAAEIATPSARIRNTALHRGFPDGATPTWAEYFDEIARQTKSTWRYDPESRSWLFESIHVPLPYTLSVADGWSTQDQADLVAYVPPGAPVAMAVYVATRYEGRLPPEKAVALRDSAALSMARTVEPGAGLERMSSTAVGGIEALYFEAPVPRRAGITWRQWGFTRHGHVFLVVSTLSNADADRLLPDVRRMVESFRVHESE